METVERVLTKIAKINTFPGYDEDDIKQEGRIIAMAVLDKYTEDRGTLENYLYISVIRRLRNLKSAKYYNKRMEGGINEVKRKIVSPELAGPDTKSYEHDFDAVDIQEIKDLMLKYLPTPMRKDYYKILEGVYVKYNRKEIVMAEVQRIYDLIMSDRVEELERELWESTKLDGYQ